LEWRRSAPPPALRSAGPSSRSCFARWRRSNRRNLSDEIDALLDSNDLPSQLTEDVDAIRVVGNFAAHPIKSTATGQIVPVETGEAEWLMDVLEELFDFYFVRRDAREGRRDKLNQKLRDAGKPELRTGTDGQSVGRSI